MHRLVTGRPSRTCTVLITVGPGRPRHLLKGLLATLPTSRCHSKGWSTLVDDRRRVCPGDARTDRIVDPLHRVNRVTSTHCRWAPRAVRFAYAGIRARARLTGSSHE